MNRLLKFFQQRTYFQSASIIWNVVLMSLPLDALILLIDLSKTPLEEHLELLDTITIILLCIGVICTARGAFFKAGDLVRSMQKKVVSSNRRYQWLLIAVIVLASIAEMVLKVGRLGISIFPILAGIMTSIAVAVSVRKSLIAKEAELRTLEGNPQLRMQLFNRQVFLFSILPLFDVRLISIIGAIKANILHQPLYMIAYTLVSLCFLLTLAPSHDLFVVRCPRCGRIIPRALSLNQSCPNCGAGR